MTTEAGTPEDLDALLEDAFLLRDRQAISRLFTGRAVLVPTDGVVRQVRGAEEIADFVSNLWNGDAMYVSSPRRVVQAGDIALVVGDRSTTVLRRDRDRAWRYVIAVVSFTDDHRSTGVPKEPSW